MDVCNSKAATDLRMCSFSQHFIEILKKHLKSLLRLFSSQRGPSIRDAMQQSNSSPEVTGEWVMPPSQFGMLQEAFNATRLNNLTTARKILSQSFLKLDEILRDFWRILCRHLT